MSGQNHRQDELSALDTVLELYSSSSVLTLLRAALDSPGCARFHDHLLVAWTRALALPERNGRAATATDLPTILYAAFEAAPDCGITIDRTPNSPAQEVYFALGERGRFAVHPGELNHPLLVLRSLYEVADTVDDHLVRSQGFGLGDVLELVLRHTDHTVTALAPVWSRVARSEPAGQISCVVTDAEIAAAGGLGTDHLTTPGAGGPKRTAAALAYLTRDLEELSLSYEPDLSLLGPALIVSSSHGKAPVPASAALETAAAAAGALLGTHPPPPEAQMRLRRRTVARVARLLGLDHMPADPGEVCRISSPSHRLKIAVVATLADDLAALLKKARAGLLDSPDGAGRLVVYAGPRILGPEVITDTVYVHVEELTEIAAAAGGDLALLALWVLELTGHPGIDAIAYEDVLDAWTIWHAQGTLLPPGPAEEGVAVVPPVGRDVSWDRAAVWACTDSILAAVGLPPALNWSACRLTEALEGSGQWADLVQKTDEQQVLACVSSHPPLVILATLNSDARALLDEAAFAGLADGIRGTLAGHPDLARYCTLPSRRPVLLHLTETIEPHQPPSDGLPQASDDVLPLLVATDADTARINIVLDPPLLARFTDDGHRILGLALHHTIGALYPSEHAGPRLDAARFTAAWDAAAPVLTWYGTDPYTPPLPPPHHLPSTTPHLRARALRTATDAVRAADMPTGTFTGPDAMRREGPAEQLLHVLENTLADQIRSYRPDLVLALARHLNAALAARTYGRQEAVTALARTQNPLWQEEARRREADAASTTSAMQLLLQQCLITPPTGEKSADLIAVADLTALAELLRDAALVIIPAGRRLHPATLIIHPSGIFTIEDTTATTDPATGAYLGFDVTAYHRAREEQWLARARTDEPQPLDPEVLFTLRRGGRTPVTFTPLSPPAGTSLARADAELALQWGCGLDALAAVLATAADWPVRTDGAAFTGPEELAHEAAAWAQLSKDHTRAAVDHLLLHPGNAAGLHDHAYTEIERRIRLTTHPLLAYDDGILIAPWLVHTSQQLYAAYLADGRLPRPDTPPTVTNLLDRHRQQRNNKLEADLAQAATRAGLPHRAGLEPGPAAKAGIPGLTGEIDLLAADPARKRLWVIEAKNPHGAVGVHNVAQGLGRFTTYRKKLQLKARTIQDHAEAAARACGSTASEDWSVVPLFVTRSIDAAAFTADPEIAFTTIDHLAALLTAPILPKPGWNPDLPTHHAPSPVPEDSW